MEIRSCHCTRMTDMGETCSYVAAAIFGVKAAVRIGLTNLSCASSAIEWLPCRKDIEPTKIKDSNFYREDFAQRGKKKRPLVASPKKKFSTLAKSDRKPLSLLILYQLLKKLCQTLCFLLLFRNLKLTLFEKLLQTGLGRLM